MGPCTHMVDLDEIQVSWQLLDPALAIRTTGVNQQMKDSLSTSLYNFAF